MQYQARGSERTQLATMTESDFRFDGRELGFFLFELFALGELLPPGGRWTVTRVRETLEAATAFSQELGRHYRSADREGCRMEAGGRVEIPASFRALWSRYVRDWRGLVVGDGGESAPILLYQVIFELFLGANPSFMTYGGFNVPAIGLIEKMGSPQQREMLLPHLRAYRWDACFCATESDAGSDVSAVRSQASIQNDGTFALTGEKRYISAAAHDLTENTLYVVVARTSDTPQNSYQLSCFIVPRLWPDASGALLPNHVECVRIESKMGLRGCANAHLVFGRRGTTRAWALGDRTKVGLLQLRPLMQQARMSTGLFGLGMASSAYLHSLEYARQRVQGRRFEEAGAVQASPVRIIEHADVQRMLLEMKSKVEGCRALLGLLSRHATELQRAEARTGSERARHQAMVSLYTPIVKAYISDQAWRICELAIQVHGGAGYLQDLPLEQYARDVKVLSIWEGTNYIQAQDLVREKLRFGRESKLVGWFAEDLREFLLRQDRFPMLEREFAALRTALAALLDATERIAQLSIARRFEPIAQFCTRYLSAFAQTAVAWKLLEAACLSSRASAAGGDAAFHRGHVVSARYFIHNELPRVILFRDLLANDDAAFASVGSEELGFTGHAATRPHCSAFASAG